MATITTINNEEIIFSDGSRISYDHDHDCCEDNYADFEQLDDIARGTDFNTNDMVFKKADCGFMFGNEPTKMFFVPCYSEQNGYYTTDVDIYYNGNEVLETEGKFLYVEY